MKQIILLFSAIFSGFLACSQDGSTDESHVSYKYDAAGNRISRTTTIIKLTKEEDKFVNPEITYIEDSFSNASVSVSPNPTKGIIYVNFNGNESIGDIRLHVFDISGKEMIQQTLQPGGSEIDLSKEASGMYFLKIQSKNDMIEYKIIKE